MGGASWLARRPVAAGDPTHALFAAQSHSIVDNLVALFEHSRAWNCSNQGRALGLYRPLIIYGSGAEPPSGRLSSTRCAAPLAARCTGLRRAFVSERSQWSRKFSPLVTGQLWNRNRYPERRVPSISPLLYADPGSSGQVASIRSQLRVRALHCSLAPE